jgi:hypothetical protein
MEVDILVDCYCGQYTDANEIAPLTALSGVLLL